MTPLKLMSSQGAPDQLPDIIPLNVGDFNSPGYILTITRNNLLDKIIIQEPSKVSKSFLVFQIARHVCDGIPM